MGLGRLRLCAPVLLAAAGSLAQADTIYSNSFDTAPTGGEWSKTTASTTVSPFGSFLGRFERETVTLTLGSIDPPGGGGGGGDNGGGGGGDSGGIVGGGTHSPIDNFRDGRGGGLGGGFHAFKSRPISPVAVGVVVMAAGTTVGEATTAAAGRGTTSWPRARTRLTFDLYLFDTWDGRDPTFGTDSFKVNVNGRDAVQRGA
jgi:hypothetical protein